MYIAHYDTIDIIVEYNGILPQVKHSCSAYSGSPTDRYMYDGKDCVRMSTTLK